MEKSLCIFRRIKCSKIFFGKVFPVHLSAPVAIKYLIFCYCFLSGCSFFQTSRTIFTLYFYSQGSNLCPDQNSCSKDTVHVTVGSEPCEITKYTFDQILCDPPAIEDGQQHPLTVSVRVFIYLFVFNRLLNYPIAGKLYC